MVMPPDVRDLITVAAVAGIALLVVPKRAVRSVPARLRAVAAGDRHHVFQPPTGGELRRVIELGLPLHVIATVAEQRGARRRLASEVAWHRSPAGLLFEHLIGRMTESEVGDALRAAGAPPPAPKLRWSPPVRLTMPPMSWRTEWERHLDSVTVPAQTASEFASPPPPVAETPRPPKAVDLELEIRTLGEICLCANGEDLAPRLLHRPAQAVTWLYLLVREARRTGDRVIRGVFADELFPGLSPDRQRRKARQRLADLNRDLPKPLLRRLVVDGEYVGLDLTGCDLDVRRVLDLTTIARTLDADDLLAPASVAQVEWALRMSAQEFLPGWEEIERRATDGRSGMGELVTAVREQIETAHLRLLEALADAHLARHRPADAARLLEQAVGRRPERSDLARKLVVACERGGLARRAADLRTEYGLEEPRQ
jgi:hypothetical protein